METIQGMLALSDYDYHLPDELIAQNPAVPRDACRLLALDRATGAIRHRAAFRDVLEHLGENDLLVINDTRVMPARLFGVKPTGGRVELLLLHEREENAWECLVRPGRRLPVGTVIELEAPASKNGNGNGNGRAANGSLRGEITARSENGTRLVKFSAEKNLREILPSYGEIPFPPYVTDSTCDPVEYQTVYAKREGSVAAPTAGLHFTENLIDSLKAKGVGFAEVTLHVGWGTFRPVRADSIVEHKMEKEWYSVSEEAADAINRAASEKKRIVAVGTTACRVLESIPKGTVTPGSGWTDLFIYPGFEFKRVGGLITNFHLPKSTLLMLVSAFAGADNIRRAYVEAVKERYRFYSFGDAMLIL